MEKKVCKVCGRELPLSHFRKNHLSQDGYVSTCTQCVTRKRKEGEDKTLDVTPPPRHTMRQPRAVSVHTT